jgi:hypothetical protein
MAATGEQLIGRYVAFMMLVMFLTILFVTYPLTT